MWQPEEREKEVEKKSKVSILCKLINFSSPKKSKWKTIWKSYDVNSNGNNRSSDLLSFHLVIFKNV